MATHYHYIITGSGCSGLSLLYRMMQHPFFSNKQILVVDQSLKTKNDRTWCFWEQYPGIFEEIVHHRWKQIDFYSSYYSARLDITPYEYKMIRGIDFYDHVLNKAKKFSNIHFQNGTVKDISNERKGGVAIMFVDNERYYSDYVFNSVILKKQGDSGKLRGKYYHLLQHFKGWLIKTPANMFDDHVAYFMDFRVSQMHGTGFVYMLPVAPYKALVEYTLFSKNILQPHQYDEALRQYIKEYLKLDNYSIEEEESGVIPMTNHPFSKGEGRIVNTGIAGGQTKASSGFTFQFIQKHADALIGALVNNKDPHVSSSFAASRFGLYDSILLNILHYEKMSVDKIFAGMFSKIPAQLMFRFLDNETNLREELKIMRSVPASIFFPAAIKEIFAVH